MGFCSHCCFHQIICLCKDKKKKLGTCQTKRKKREIGRRRGTEGSFVQFNCSVAYMKKKRWINNLLETEVYTEVWIFIVYLSCHSYHFAKWRDRISKWKLGCISHGSPMHYFFTIDSLFLHICCDSFSSNCALFGEWLIFWCLFTMSKSGIFKNHPSFFSLSSTSKHICLCMYCLLIYNWIKNSITAA